MNHPWIGLTGTITAQPRRPGAHGIIVAIGPDYDEFDAGPGNTTGVYLLPDDGGCVRAWPLHRFMPDDADDARARLVAASTPSRRLVSG